MNTELATKQIKLIKEIFKTAEKNKLFIFIKGGWNIDLSLGRQTRNHEDIDFHFDLKDKEFWIKYFLKKSYRKEEKDKWTLVFTSHKGVKLDFEAVKVFNKSLVWKHGGSSKTDDVCQDKNYSGFKFKGMRLEVEKYLKERHVEKGGKLRTQDKHDLKIIEDLKK